MELQQQIMLAVDAVLFGYSRNEGVSVLLIKRKLEPFIHQWALPGGFVHKNESLEEAVYRELEEETGVKVTYLEQLYSFGKPERDPRMRIVSVAYFGIVKSESFRLHASTDAEDANWYSIKKLPKLAFDHKNIIKTALERLRAKIKYEPLGFELLSTRFLFSDLEHLYATLLDRDIDRRNFKKKIMQLGFVEVLSEKDLSSTVGRPGNLYKFNKDKYFKLKKDGFSFVLNL